MFQIPRSVQDVAPLWTTSFPTYSNTWPKKVRRKCPLLTYMRYHNRVYFSAFPLKNQGNPATAEMFLKVLEMHPEILHQILSFILNAVMYEDCRNQWSMSRPLLGIILLHEEYFAQMRENIIRWVLEVLYSNISQAHVCFAGVNTQINKRLWPNGLTL